MTSPRYFALIPAAGVGARLGAGRPKQYLAVAGKPIISHVLETFAASQAISHTFVVVSEDDGWIGTLCSEQAYPRERMTVLRRGGETRKDTVLNGLHAIREQVRDDDWVMVHDAARPGLTTDLIDRLVRALRDDPIGGLLALPVVDTLKRVDAQGRAQATVPRDGLWAAQTPQMFRYALLRRALESAQQATDEASAVEALGLRPKAVQGEARNFKITMPADIALAELYLSMDPAPPEISANLNDTNKGVA
jgi:2-C-methyl-D-erythritol 4-phosphate cytidylyltransferase